MSRTVRPLLPVAEGALIALSLATVAGFWRLFDNGSFFGRLALIVLVAHGTSIVARRLGWSLAAALGLSLVTLAVTIGLTLYPDTTILGLPTGATFSAVRADLSEVWTQFQSVQAPTPVTTPFLLAAGLSLFWAAFVADWAAFRLWVPFEAIVPAGTVFVFSSLFAAHRDQVTSAGMFIVAAFAFVLVHRVTRQQSSSGWVSSDVQRGTNAMLKVGGALVAVAVAVAMVVGPNLPQAHSEALVGWRNTGDGPGARTTVSPLVQIQQRLVDLSNVELFTVRSDHRSYWRLTALDEFDGQVWASNGSYERADGSLPQGIGTDASAELTTQTYSIDALDTIWLPAAFEPRSVDAKGTSVRWEPGTATLIVGTELANSNGTSYSVQSALPIFDPQQLENAPDAVPKDIAVNDTELPSDFSDRVTQEAQRVVAGKTTVYDKALALQDYFRDNFTYDLNVPPGHSDSAIESFLFDTRRGFCEQFAGTYAAMARAIGLPSRVAVGFTPGEEDATQAGLYHVRGLHAHAWPEVYISGQGWVLFEPTPTRGAPNAQQYTHVPEEQGTASGGATTIGSTAPTTTAASATPKGPTATTRPQEDVNAGGDSTTKQQEPSFWNTSRFGGRALIVLAVLLALALLYAAIVPIAYLLHRHRRRRQAIDADDQVRVAWQEGVEAVGLLGVAPARAETPAEFASRAEHGLGADGLSELAGLLQQASYSADGVDDDGAERAYELSEHVGTVVRRQATRGQRVAAALDPRPPERRRPINRRRPGGPDHSDAPKIEILKL
jgi:transglutaminase-like putative cysteine protease